MTAPALGSDRLWHALPAAVVLSGRVDQVEIKAILDGGLAAMAALLGPNLGGPVSRRVHHLDTPDLELAGHGLVVRARETTGARDDVVVKLRRAPHRGERRNRGLSLSSTPFPRPRRGPRRCHAVSVPGR